MDKAAFSFVNYYFKKAIISFPEENDDKFNLDIAFNPKGIFVTQENIYVLSLQVIITINDKNNNVNSEIVNVDCEAKYQFANKLDLEEIPSYFYPNSIAILFPYIRSFVSTLTLQANVNPIVLPTMNLTNLQEELKKNTIAI